MSEFDLSQPLLIDESLVVEFLLDNPDFFARHPSLIKQLRLPHKEKGAVSLVELQVQRLRDKVLSLEQEITDLMTVASLNERIYHVYVDLLPDLMACDSFAELQHRLSRALVDDLGVECVSMRLSQKLFNLEELPEEYGLEHEQIERIRVTRLSQQPHYFGRMSKGELAVLFDNTDDIASVALMPLGINAELGFFIAASRDADHYVAGMDSLLLTQLCQVINSLLLRLVPLNAEQ
ncbi:MULTISPECIES: DUF484 family protein [unclassified Agarivorans]|nr:MULTISPECIES: DUF484 family protein [unclassified Agarivorans]MDO6685654.1 DUF484 family protein [Agarivorans sp. 3_MG-2023]MDO6716231.1 DUF484 family protein [Agarivorans sp. 2_MG-2023]MDO6764398.1 DUF484 family protein [Agarivorans sp. 1_MG-2023]GDY27343.1 DUF484 family protein [Agarivorans sp. Toyoura001]